MALWCVSASAQAPIVGPGQAIGFDYADADLEAYAVTRFEASWDAGAFVPLVWEARMYADTPAGYTTYRIVPPFTVGVHTVVIRACNTTDCGQGSAPFGFAYGVIDPVSPGALRVVP